MSSPLLRWERAEWNENRGELIERISVSTEGRDSSRALSAKLFLFSDLGALRFFHRRYVFLMLFDVAFLILRHNPTCSSAVLTLLKPTRRCTGELLSSASKTVRLQSSTASLRAVTARMNIRGTALRPGLAAPKMAKNYSHDLISIIHCNRVTRLQSGVWMRVLTPRMMMKRK